MRTLRHLMLLYHFIFKATIIRILDNLSLIVMIEITSIYTVGMKELDNLTRPKVNLSLRNSTGYHEIMRRDNFFKNEDKTRTRKIEYVAFSYCYYVCIFAYYYYYFFFFFMSSPSRSPLPPPSPPGPSRSSQSTRSERLSHASNLGWWSVSPLIVYMFRCCSLEYVDFWVNRQCHTFLLCISHCIFVVYKEFFSLRN